MPLAKVLVLRNNGAAYDQIVLIKDSELPRSDGPLRHVELELERALLIAVEHSLGRSMPGTELH